MGAARYTRHSFARTFLRTANRQRWSISRERFEVDDKGRGDVVYRVETPSHHFRFVAFSTVIDEAARTDRVIADSWDVTAALIDSLPIDDVSIDAGGELSTERLKALRSQVTKQEEGRADASTIIWARANRSARFFDYVVDQLTAGEQPEGHVIGDGAYVLRSTAFYSNGKWGLTDFERLGVDHPLAVPYRAQMLTAWLLRELSYDLVEHCAASRSPTASVLDQHWRRYFGLGNATGLGMVPFVINHPRILDAWMAVRELPLATALASSADPTSEVVAKVEEHLARAVNYFSERDTLSTNPYPSGPELAAGLRTILAAVNDYRRTGAIGGRDIGGRFAATLHDTAANVGLEVRQVVDSVLVEIHEEIDDDIEQLLRCDEQPLTTLSTTCSELTSHLASDYAWVESVELDTNASAHYFWYTSQSSEEPRRGLRGVDAGESVEHPLAVARAVAALKADLDGFEESANLAEFLLAHPWHRGAIDRVQSLAGVHYGEVRTNPCSADFLPLDLQRFQLAMYGMENYSPQSTDWLRVTLFSGAPRADDVAAGIGLDDWLFAPKPPTPHSALAGDAP